MKKSDIRVKEKILFIGETGVKKTMSCCKIAGEVSKAGGNVLYIDTEYGAEKYLLEMSDKELENIELVVPKGFMGIKYSLVKFATGDYGKESIEKVMEKEWFDYITISDVKVFDLVIVDPFDIVKEARLEARKRYLEQGYYYIGEKKVSIDNKSTFGLRGYMYETPNTWATELYDFMVRSKYHFIHTVMLPNKYVEEFYGYYDSVFHLTKAENDFEAKVIKLRGGKGGKIGTDKLAEKIAKKLKEVVSSER